MHRIVGEGERAVHYIVRVMRMRRTLRYVQSRHINIIDVAIVITKIPTLKRLGKLTSLANHIKTDCL